MYFLVKNKMKKSNPFVITNIIINLCAAIWYFKHGGYKIGTLHLLYSGCASITLWIGVV